MFPCLSPGEATGVLENLFVWLREKVSRLDVMLSS